MTTLDSIFKIYGIKEALIKNEEMIEIIILKKEQNLTLNRWMNFINSLKYSFKKEVRFILKKDISDLTNFKKWESKYE